MDIIIIDFLLVCINVSVRIFLNTFGERLKHIHNIRVYFHEILSFVNCEKEYLETLLESIQFITTLGLIKKKKKWLGYTYQWLKYPYI